MGSTRATDEMEALSRTVARLRPWPVRGKPLPNLLFFTDPERTPDPERAAERLPIGAAVVFRAFGAPDAAARGRRLRQITRRRGLTLLVGADAALALEIEADGLHLPERLAAQAPDLRVAHPDWLITLAAHDLAAALAGAATGADALVVSPVFPSRSPSAGAPLGVDGLKQIVEAVEAPVYALGGVRADTATLLLDTGIVGIAAVEALSA
ncbi:MULTISPECIES: thiamine phosphate synthase [unclassified Caulobacter]|uniref:thiamine phosphate synthase n=1 Tax=unclassified Caulobacter TaxID=2648921 RepID=UPI0009EB946D|nr:MULTISPECIES: thiamine phosphate synthase [unclassified Caulobacter]